MGDGALFQTVTARWPVLLSNNIFIFECHFTLPFFTVHRAWFSDKVSPVLCTAIYLSTGPQCRIERFSPKRWPFDTWGWPQLQLIPHQTVHSDGAIMKVSSTFWRRWLLQLCVVFCALNWPALNPPTRGRLLQGLMSMRWSVVLYWVLTPQCLGDQHSSRRTPHPAPNTRSRDLKIVQTTMIYSPLFKWWILGSDCPTRRSNPKWCPAATLVVSIAWRGRFERKAKKVVNGEHILI